MAKKLTNFQERCCTAFMENGGNQTQAYLECSERAKKWKPETVWETSSKLFNQPHVHKYLEELKVRARQIGDEKLDISIERVLQEYAKVAFADIRQLFTQDGRLKTPAEHNNSIAGAIASIDVVTKTIGTGEDRYIEFTHKIKLNNKLHALDSLARYLGIFDGPIEDEPKMIKYRGVRVPDWMAEMIPVTRDSG